jgi:polysaccharide pyruvyl transferase WcaK-like protein
LNKPFFKILIAEWVPSLNKGELAILLGMLETFQILGKVKVSIFSFYPSLDKERYPSELNIIDVEHDLYLPKSLPEKARSTQIKASLLAAFQHFLFILLYIIFGKHAKRILNKTLWKEYCESDLIIICHNQVSCIGGFILDFSPVYITLLAKILRKPVVIYANGTHSFGSRIWEFLALFVLNNVDLITTRDEDSFLYLKRFVWNSARIYLTGDPSILLRPSFSEKVKDALSMENTDKSKMLVGVALSHEVLSDAFPTIKDPSVKYQKAVIEIGRLLDNLIERFGAQIIFIPHCIEPYRRRDDRIVAKDIYKCMKNKHKVCLIDKEYSPEELKALMSKFNLLISTRVHAAVSALSTLVPSIVITRPTDKRAYGLVGKNLDQEKWIYNIINLNADELFIYVKNLLLASDKMRNDLPFTVNLAKKKALLNGILLKALMNSRFKSKV